MSCYFWNVVKYLTRIMTEDTVSSFSARDCYPDIFVDCMYILKCACMLLSLCALENLYKN